MRIELQIPDEIAACMETLAINGYSLQESILDAVAAVYAGIVGSNDLMDDPERHRAAMEIRRLVGTSEPYDFQDRLQRFLFFFGGGGKTTIDN